MAIVKPRPLLPLLGALAVAALAATGCATGRAQVIEESPTLALPPVPPRAIEPQPTVEPVEIEPVAPLPVPRADVVRGQQLREVPTSPPLPPLVWAYAALMAAVLAAGIAWQAWRTRRERGAATTPSSIGAPA